MLVFSTIQIIEYCEEFKQKQTYLPKCKDDFKGNNLKEVII